MLDWIVAVRFGNGAGEQRFAGLIVDVLFDDPGAAGIDHEDSLQRAGSRWEPSAKLDGAVTAR